MARTWCRRRAPGAPRCCGGAVLTRAAGRPAAPATAPDGTVRALMSSARPPPLRCWVKCAFGGRPAPLRGRRAAAPWTRSGAGRCAAMLPGSGKGRSMGRARRPTARAKPARERSGGGRAACPRARPGRRGGREGRPATTSPPPPVLQPRSAPLLGGHADGTGGPSGAAAHPDLVRAPGQGPATRPAAGGRRARPRPLAPLAPAPSPPAPLPAPAGGAGRPARGAPPPAARGPHRWRRGLATASGAPRADYTVSWDISPAPESRWDPAQALLGEPHPQRLAWGGASREPRLAGPTAAVITALAAALTD